MPKAKRWHIVDDNTMEYIRPEKHTHFTRHRITKDNIVISSDVKVDRADMLDSEVIKEWQRLLNYISRLKYNSLWIDIPWESKDPLFPLKD